MAHAHVVTVRVEDKLRVVLVYCVICEVHVLFVEVTRCWLDIWFSRQPSQALPEHIQPKGVRSAEQDVNPEVELQTVQEKRAGQVTLNHIVFSILEII